MKFKFILPITCVLCIICAIFCLCRGNQKSYRIDDEASFFSDFTVDEGKVFLYYTLFIDNFTGMEKEVVISALFEDDVENSLLKQAKLYAYSVEDSTKFFKLKKGRNQLDVVFIGEHAGGKQKQDRLLPDIEISEKTGDGSLS